MVPLENKEITMPAEWDSGYCVKIPSWHRGENLLEEAPTSPEESVQAGDMAWFVDKEPLFVRRFDEDGSVRFVEIKSHCANTRSDRLNDYENAHGVLGVVGAERYNVQNVELFRFFQPWIEAGLIEMSAAVSLRGGKRICITAEIKGAEIEVVPGDVVKRYVTMAHAHDTSLALRLGFTNTRTVCSNTLQVMLQTSDLLKHRHTANCMINMEAARDLFDVQRAEMRVQADIFQALARFNLSDDAATSYFREVFHEGAGTNAKIVVRGTDRLLELFEAGRGAHFSRGTLWGAFNAVTEFATHERGRKDTDNAHRFETNMFGQGSVLLGRALSVAQTILSKG
jgi:phage/plasmid-like protein (TIGR03299 family)